MVATWIQESAMLVAAFAVLLVGLAALVLVWRKAFQSVSIKAGSLEASLDAVKQSVEQINTAVNHVAPGSPTLVQRVADTEQKIDYLVQAVEAIGQHVGCAINKPGGK